MKADSKPGGGRGGQGCIIAHYNQAIKRNGKSVRVSRDELVHGFILVYSTRRKASLSTLRYRMVSVRRYVFGPSGSGSISTMYTVQIRLRILL